MAQNPIDLMQVLYVLQGLQLICGIFKRMMKRGFQVWRTTKNSFTQPHVDHSICEVTKNQSIYFDFTKPFRSQTETVDLSLIAHSVANTLSHHNSQREVDGDADLLYEIERRG